MAVPWDSNLGMIFQPSLTVGSVQHPFPLECPTVPCLFLALVHPLCCQVPCHPQLPPAAASSLASLRRSPPTQALLRSSCSRPPPTRVTLNNPLSPESQFSGLRNEEQNKMVSILIVLRSQMSLRFNPGPGAPHLSVELSLSRVKWEQGYLPLTLL